MKFFGYCSFLVIIAVCEARYRPGEIPDFYAMVEPHMKVQIPKYMQLISRDFKLGAERFEAVEKNFSIAETKLSSNLNNIFADLPQETLKIVQDTIGTVSNEKALKEQIENGVSKLVNNYLEAFRAAGEGIATLKADLLARESPVNEQVVKKEIPKLIDDFVKKMKPEESKTKSQQYVNDLKGPGSAKVVADARQKFESLDAKIEEVEAKIEILESEETMNLMMGFTSLVDQISENFVKEGEKAAVKEKLAQLIGQKYVAGLLQSELQSSIGDMVEAYRQAQETINLTSDTVVTEVDYQLKRLTQSISTILMSTFD